MQTIDREGDTIRDNTSMVSNEINLLRSRRLDSIWRTIAGIGKKRLPQIEDRPKPVAEMH